MKGCHSFAKNVLKSGTRITCHFAGTL